MLLTKKTAQVRTSTDLRREIARFHWTRLMNDSDSWWHGVGEDSDEVRAEYPEGIILGTVADGKFTPSHHACGTRVIMGAFTMAEFDAELSNQFPTEYTYQRSRPSANTSHPWTIAMSPCDGSEE